MFLLEWPDEINMAPLQSRHRGRIVALFGKVYPLTTELKKYRDGDVIDSRISFAYTPCVQVLSMH